MATIPKDIEELKIGEGVIWCETGFGYVSVSTGGGVSRGKFIWNTDQSLHPISSCSNLTSLSGGLIILTILPKTNSLQASILTLNTDTTRPISNLINPQSSNVYYTQPDIFYELEGKFYVNHVLKGDRFIGEGRELKVGRGGYILSGYGGVEEEVLVGDYSDNSQDKKVWRKDLGVIGEDGKLGMMGEEVWGMCRTTTNRNRWSFSVTSLGLSLQSYHTILPSTTNIEAVVLSPTSISILLDDQMHLIQRKSRAERVGILIRKNLYLIAVSLLENEKGSRREKVRVGEEYGKYLCRLGETQKAVEVFKGLGEGAKGVRCLMDEGLGLFLDVEGGKEGELEEEVVEEEEDLIDAFEKNLPALEDKLGKSVNDLVLSYYYDYDDGIKNISKRIREGGETTRVMGGGERGRREMCQLKDKGRVLRRFVEMREEEGSEVDEDIEELCEGMELGEVLEILKSEDRVPVKSIRGIVEEGFGALKEKER
ncbi:hypothetical protein TL16_g03723 [Triparma laevis f. inornata]|nr:hypothetical protein TrLO_g12687 [Triparma laevis f. longispina]GMH63473.1 hypothetical protein TL16_g03723 [Triparma laevis f. inornata]